MAQRHEYAAARVEVRFQHEEYDWLEMVVMAGSAAITCRISSVFCPFQAMLRWLEAMCTGVQICGFEWDAEGIEGRICWDFRRLRVQWPLHSAGARCLDELCDRKQVVDAFYCGFRRFVESAEYDPDRYEEPVVGVEYSRPRHGFGAPLRELRSGTVERWLSAQGEGL